MKITITIENIESLIWLEYEGNNWYKEISLKEAEVFLVSLFNSESEAVGLNDEEKNIVKGIIKEVLSHMESSTNQYSYNILNYSFSVVTNKYKENYK